MMADSQSLNLSPLKKWQKTIQPKKFYGRFSITSLPDVNTNYSRCSHRRPAKPLDNTLAYTIALTY